MLEITAKKFVKPPYFITTDEMSKYIFFTIVHINNERTPRLSDILQLALL